MKKSLYTCVLILFVISGCATPNGHVKHENIISNRSNRPYLELVDEHNPFLKYNHIESHIATGMQTERGKPFGKIQPYPKRLSVKFHDEIQASRQYYDAHEFQKAVDVLAIPYQREPDNEFLLEAYARALYRIDARAKSYDVYKMLFNILDKNRKEDTIEVDFWFPEAYWKIATLYLDMKKWDEAIYELTRLLEVSFYNMPRDVYAQVLTYLTEAYFNKGNYDLAQYYGLKTIQEFPMRKNEYVADILTKIKQKTSKIITTLQYDSKIKQFK